VGSERRMFCAVEGVMVIQGRWFWHQSKSRMRLPISDQNNLGPVLQHFWDMATYWPQNRQFFLPNSQLTPSLSVNLFQFLDEPYKSRDMHIKRTILQMFYFTWPKFQRFRRILYFVMCASCYPLWKGLVNFDFVFILVYILLLQKITLKLYDCFYSDTTTLYIAIIAVGVGVLCIVAIVVAVVLYCYKMKNRYRKFHKDYDSVHVKLQQLVIGTFNVTRLNRRLP